jgi:transcriptional regulator with XRE-family HTH domain
MDGRGFRKWRKQLGFSQEEAAKHFDVTRATIQNWEYEITSLPGAIDRACQECVRRLKSDDLSSVVYFSSTSTTRSGKTPEGLMKSVFCTLQFMRITKLPCSMSTELKTIRTSSIPSSWKLMVTSFGPPSSYCARECRPASKGRGPAAGIDEAIE